MGEDEAKLTDIRMRKRVKPSFLASIVKSSDDAIIGMTLDGIMLSWNSGAQKIYYYSADEMIGKSISLLVPPDHTNEIPSLLKRAGQGESIKNFETVRIRKDGKQIDIFLTVSPVKDADGRIIAISSIARDITGRKKAEAQLRESEEKYRNLIELTTDIVYISDIEGNQIFLNNAGYRILEATPEEVIGQSWLKWIHPDDRERTFKKFIEMIEKGIDVFDFENRYVSKSGRVIDVLHNVRILRDKNGEVIGTQGTARDITERKRLEDEQRREKELSDALNSINTALNSTLDFDEIMRRVVIESMRAINAETSAILLLENNYWVLRYFYGKLRDQEPELVGIQFTYEQAKAVALAARTAEPVILSDAYNDKRVNTDLAKKYQLRSIISIPLIAREEVIGNISFAYHSAPVDFKKAEIDFSRKLATSVSLAVQNARLFEERKRVEEALEKERDKAQNYLNIAGVMIVVIDTDQKVTLVNKKCYEVLRYNEQEIIGRNWFDTFIPERARDEVRTAFMKLVAGEIEPVEYFENPVLTREGTERLIAWHNTVLRDDAGNITGTLSSGEDITEHKRAEEELKRSKELSDALNRINITINSTLDFDEIMRRVVVEAAKAIGCETAAITLREDNYWIMRYHYSFPAEMTGLRLTDEEILHGALAAQSKQTVVINDAYKDKRVNLEVMKKYGVRSVLVAPLMVKGSVNGLIYFNYHSAPIAFTSAQVDFANKLATSVSLAMQNTRLFSELEKHAKTIEALYAVYRVVSQSLDLDTIFRDALSKALEVTEVDAGGVYLLEEDGENLILKHYQGVSPELAKAFSKVKVGVGIGGMAVKSGKPVTLDVEKYPSSPLRSLLEKNGIYSLASTPLMVMGKAIGAMTFISRRRRSFSRDDLDLIASIGSQIGVAVENARLYEELKMVAEERERWAAELARSNAELEQFAYIASHDLQEPLRMISGFTQLLAKRYRGRLDKDADEFIAFIVDGTMRMQKIIEDLLAYSRVGTRGKPFELTDLESVYDQAATNLKVQIEENKAQVTHDPLPVVMADASQMVQLFQNLLSNAIKFKKRDETPHIHISVKRKKNEYLFSIQDNGIGIAPEFMNRLFQLFQREHTTGEYPGTGIGLAVCKRITERHGGRIWAESKHGKGSIFHFTIPVRGE